MCGRPLAFRNDKLHNSFTLARLSLANVQSKNRMIAGKAEPFRISGGKAAYHPVATAPGTDSLALINVFRESIFARSTSQSYPFYMASFVEVEKLALALSEDERATLAAKLIDSLRDSNSDDDGSRAVRFKTVNSSMLRRVRYDPESRFLDVVFRTGETYRYKDVPADEYEGLIKAGSHGKYMQMRIIDHYETERLEN